MHPRPPGRLADSVPGRESVPIDDGESIRRVEHHMQRPSVGQRLIANHSAHTSALGEWCQLRAGDCALVQYWCVRHNAVELFFFTQTWSLPIHFECIHVVLRVHSASGSLSANLVDTSGNQLFQFTSSLQFGSNSTLRLSIRVWFGYVPRISSKNMSFYSCTLPSLHLTCSRREHICRPRECECCKITRHRVPTTLDLSDSESGVHLNC